MRLFCLLLIFVLAGCAKNRDLKNKLVFKIEKVFVVGHDVPHSDDGRLEFAISGYAKVDVRDTLLFKKRHMLMDNEGDWPFYNSIVKILDSSGHLLDSLELFTQDPRTKLTQKKTLLFFMGTQSNLVRSPFDHLPDDEKIRVFRRAIEGSKIICIVAGGRRDTIPVNLSDKFEIVPRAASTEDLIEIQKSLKGSLKL